MSLTTRFIASAPSNIALIKYMGKDDVSSNLPANASLSMTLSSLCSWVELRLEGSEPLWVPELPTGAPAGAAVPLLGDAGVARILRHVERVRAWAREHLGAFGLTAGGLASRDSYELRSSNTFPPASGIASSASSFAALTLAAAWACSDDPAAFERAYERDLTFRRALARLSRHGSGSSCRSFEGPWVLWQGESAAALDVAEAMPEMADLVVLVKSEPKEVSSSDAHARVRASPLWEGRVERVAARIVSLESALAEGDLAAIARVSWSEAWEMHSLFHTSAVPFTYWEPGTIEALRWLMPLMDGPEPPIVTLDAGPNIHVIVPAKDREAWRERIRERFPRFPVLLDRQGAGARLEKRA